MGDIKKLDGWSSILSGLGTHQAPEHNTWFRAQRRVSPQEIDQLYYSNAVFQRICDLPADCGTKKWIKLFSDDQDLVDAVTQEFETLDLQNKIHGLWWRTRKDGGAAIVIATDEGRDDISEPLDLNRIRSMPNIHVLNAYKIRPDLTSLNEDPMSIDFQQPQFFRFSSGIGEAQELIHASRVIVLNSIEQQQFQSGMFSGISTGWSNTSYNGWGVPIIESLYDALRHYDSIYQYTEGMLKNLNTPVFTIPGLAEMLSSDDGSQALLRRLQALQMCSGVYKALVLNGASGDQPGETFTNQSVSLAGISEQMLRAADRLSAASGIPSTLLFGQDIGGLSAHDASGERNFYDHVASSQRRLLRKPIQRVLDAVLAALGHKDGADIAFEFLPLYEATELETAQTKLAQAQALATMTTALTSLMAAGIISAQEAREQLQYEGTVPSKPVPPDDVDPDTSESA